MSSKCFNMLPASEIKEKAKEIGFDACGIAQVATADSEALFFDKWLKDMRAEQNQGGGIPMIVPMVKIPGQFEMMFPLAADHWGVQGRI